MRSFVKPISDKPGILNLFAAIIITFKNLGIILRIAKLVLFTYLELVRFGIFVDSSFMHYSLQLLHHNTK